MKPKVLFVGEFTGLNTGYSQFYKTLMQAVQAQGIEVEELACCVNQNHPAIDYVPWRVHANIPTDPKELEQFRNTPGGEFGSYSFERTLLKSKCNVVVECRDSWHWEYQSRSPFRKFFSHICVPAIDNPIQNIQWLEQYRTCDALLCYTQWGCDIMKAHGVNNVLGKCSPIISPVFKPVQDKKCRQAALGLGEIKVVLSVMRNQPRKLYPDLFEAFSKFLKLSGRKDTYLYVHSDSPGTWNFDTELNKHAIGHRTLFTYICTKCGQTEPCFYSGVNRECSCGGTQMMPNGGIGATQEQLAFIYNLGDVYVQWANTEGFALPIIESASCGVLPIAVDYSAMSEVCRRVNGIPIIPLGTYIECESGRHMAVPNNDALAHELTRLISLPTQMLRQMGLKSNLMFNVNYGQNEIKQTIENLLTAVNTTKPQREWGDKTNYCHTPSNTFKGSSDNDFVKWLIVDVLGQPEYMGSQLEARLLRDLSNGYSSVGFGNLYYHELTSSRNPQGPIAFTREPAYKHFEYLAELRNGWERERLNRI